MRVDSADEILPVQMVSFARPHFAVFLIQMVGLSRLDFFKMSAWLDPISDIYISGSRGPTTVVATN